MTTRTIQIDLSKFIEPILERKQSILKVIFDLSNIRFTSKQYTLGLFDITTDPVAAIHAYAN